jgi:hypothetical protein
VAAPLDHRRQRGPDRAPLAVQVDVDAAFEFRRVDGEQRIRRWRYTGVRDGDVDAPEARHRRVRCALQRTEVTYVCFERSCAITQFVGELLERGERTPDQAHPCAFGVRLPADFRADPPCGTGHEDHAAGEFDPVVSPHQITDDRKLFGQPACDTHGSTDYFSEIHRQFTSFVCVALGRGSAFGYPMQSDPFATHRTIEEAAAFSVALGTHH